MTGVQTCALPINHPELKGNSLFWNRVWHSLGKPPIILEQGKTETSANSIKKFLVYKGFWDAHVDFSHKLDSAAKKAQAKAEAAAAAASAPKKVKLSYKDQRELEQLPAEMEKLEKEQAELSAKLADGSWFVSDANAATLASQRLAEIEESLLEKLERWDILENMSKGN